MKGQIEAQKQREQLEKFLKWVEEEGGIENPTHLSTMLSPEQMFRVQWLKRRCVGKIMELGTCYGFVLAFCNGHIGIDCNEKSIELARILNPDKQFEVADIRQLPFPDKAVDTVMLPDVLEHIPWEDVPKVLSEAFRVARKKVLITIPKDGSKKAGCFKHQWLCTEGKRQKLLRLITYKTNTIASHGFLMIEASIGIPKPQSRHTRVRHVVSSRVDLSKKVDFYASRMNYVDHMLPIYQAIPKENRGQFVVEDRTLLKYAISKGIPGAMFREYWVKIRGNNHLGPLVTGGLGQIVRFRNRKLILINHGCGGSWNVNHQSYAGGGGQRKRLKLILEPGNIPAERDKRSCLGTKIIISGCPKMDKWYPVTPKLISNPPVVAIGFHQDTKVCPESRTALPHYLSALPKLAEWQKSGEVKIIGTGHPVYWKVLLPLWQKYGFEPVLDFDEVIKRADVYVRDQYSTIYEFASLDRPVVLLNAPWYRRNVEHGIRFWALANVGIQVNEPEELIPAIKLALTDPENVKQARHEAVNKVYKFMDGTSTERAVKAILEII